MLTTRASDNRQRPMIDTITQNKVIHRMQNVNTCSSGSEPILDTGGVFFSSHNIYCVCYNKLPSYSRKPVTTGRTITIEIIDFTKSITTGENNENNC